MQDVKETLSRLGLDDYYPVLAQNGFESWSSLVEISEEDFEQLKVKRGHRRLLQREIERYKRENSQDAQSTPSGSGNSSGPSTDVTPPDEFPTTPPKTKRRYRWHPRPDPNAPKRPKTAYVRFADQLRQDPTVAAMSFVDIAKEVGWQWQRMEPGLKQKFELDAAQEMQEYEDQTRAYKQTSMYRDYQDYLENFRKAPTKPSRPRLKTHQAYEQRPVSRPSSNTPHGTSFFPVSSPSNSTTQPQEFRQLLAYSLSEFRRWAAENSPVLEFNPAVPPPEKTAKLGASAVVEVIGPFMFMWSEKDVKQLVERAYSGLALDAFSLCELYALSALGGHYCGESIPKRSLRGLMAAAARLLEEIDIEGAEPDRVMRLLTTMAVFSVLQKHLSCKALIAAALSLGRLMISSQGELPDGDIRKMYRTVTTVSCWLGCTLGYSNDEVPLSIKLSLEYDDTSSAGPSEIHSRETRVALIASEIYEIINSKATPTNDEVRQYLTRLDRWSAELPGWMRLERVMENPDSDYPYLRAILLVHVLHLAATILLLRPLVVAAEESHPPNHWKLDMTPSDFRQLQTRCDAAAHQLARVTKTVFLDQCQTRRCWLSNYWAYTACTMLLLRASQCIRSRATSEATDFLNSAAQCIETLSLCSTEEPITHQYLNSVQAEYTELMTILSDIRPVSRSLSPSAAAGPKQPRVSTIHSLLDNGDSSSNGARSSPPASPGLTDRTRDITAKLLMLVGNPFGRSGGGEASSVSRSPSPEATGGCWFR